MLHVKDIPGFSYYSITTNGKVWSKYKHRWLKATLKPNGYLSILLVKNKKHFRKYIHRLVLETFVGNCPNGFECCHANGIKTDNRLENLRWDTRSENHKDSIKHGNSPGFCNPLKRKNTKFSVDDIKLIRWLANHGMFTQQEIANWYNTTRHYISAIKRGVRWSK